MDARPDVDVSLRRPGPAEDRRQDVSEDRNLRLLFEPAPVAIGSPISPKEYEKVFGSRSVSKRSYSRACAALAIA
jgi:hypothetical protein